MKKLSITSALFITLALLILSRGSVLAQSVSTRLDSCFTELFNIHEFNGNVLVAENGTPVYQRSFGYSDVEHQVPNTPASSFQLASASKVFTSVAILQLKEKGKLKLDDPVSKYLPGFLFPNITIRHLLSHTSGLPDFQIFEALHREDTSKIFTNDDIIPALKKFNRPLMFEPGENWAYSNTGYGLLSSIIEKVSRLKYQDYLQKYICRPAGMTSTYVKTSLVTTNDSNFANGYDYQSYSPSRLQRVENFKRNKIPSIILAGITGPGNIVSTTKDLLSFDNALYNGKVLHETSLKEAFTPVTLKNGKTPTLGWANGKSYYGLGWMILCDDSFGKIVWHSGGAPGMVTVFMRNITRSQTVIVLDNVTHRGLHAQGVNAMYILNKGPLSKEKKSLAHEYTIALFEKGVDYAATRFNDLKADTANYFMNEGALNACGLDLLFDGYHAQALEVLKINTLLYPGSWNVYDSYGEALWFSGKREEAIAMYQKSIKMNPGNEGGKKALEDILKSSP